MLYFFTNHDDVIKWKHFPRNWPFVQGIHRSPVNSPHKGQWRGALMFSVICVWMNGWVNNGEAGDLWRYRSHYDATVMLGFLCNKLLTYLSSTNCNFLCNLHFAFHSTDVRMRAMAFKWSAIQLFDQINCSGLQQGKHQITKITANMTVFVIIVLLNSELRRSFEIDIPPKYPLWIPCIGVLWS